MYDFEMLKVSNYRYWLETETRLSEWYYNGTKNWEEKKNKKKQFYTKHFKCYICIQYLHGKISSNGWYLWINKLITLFWTCEGTPNDPQKCSTTE